MLRCLAAIPSPLHPCSCAHSSVHGGCRRKTVRELTAIPGRLPRVPLRCSQEVFLLFSVHAHACGAAQGVQLDSSWKTQTPGAHGGGLHSLMSLPPCLCSLPLKSPHASTLCHLSKVQVESASVGGVTTQGPHSRSCGSGRPGGLCGKDVTAQIQGIFERIFIKAGDRETKEGLRVQEATARSLLGGVLGLPRKVIGKA